MKSRIVLLVLMAMQASYVCSMQNDIDYGPLFAACKQGNIITIKQFFEDNPMCDLEYKDDKGATPVLHAAHYWRWSVVWYLLEKGADKNAQDDYGQTLFSAAVYDISIQPSFVKLLPLYSLQEINALCKSMSIPRSLDYATELVMPQLVQEVLEGKKELESRCVESKTALRKACILGRVSIIVELLKRGADLHAKDYFNDTPYKTLCQRDVKKVFFAVRESFNNGSGIPVTLICEALDKHGYMAPDIKRYIMQLYFQDQFSTPEAKLWGPIAADVCKTIGIKEENPQRCLTRILLMPQKEKTEMNMQYVLKSSNAAAMLLNPALNSSFVASDDCNVELSIALG